MLPLHTTFASSALLRNKLFLLINIEPFESASAKTYIHLNLYLSLYDIAVFKLMLHPKSGYDKVN